MHKLLKKDCEKLHLASSNLNFGGLEAETKRDVKALKVGKSSAEGLLSLACDTLVPAARFGMVTDSVRQLALHSSTKKADQFQLKTTFSQTLLSLSLNSKCPSIHPSIASLIFPLT
jgi:hypothetical protein